MGLCGFEPFAQVNKLHQLTRFDTNGCPIDPTGDHHIGLRRAGRKG